MDLQDSIRNGHSWWTIGISTIGLLPIVGMVKPIRNAGKAIDKFFGSQRAAFRAAKKDANIPMSSQPISVKKVGLECRDKTPIRYPEGHPKYGQSIETREYTFRNSNGDIVIIQEHSVGHPNFGDHRPHYNVRPADELGDAIRNKNFPGTAGHYFFKK